MMGATSQAGKTGGVIFKDQPDNPICFPDFSTFARVESQ
jgi:hypothetical protein